MKTEKQLNALLYAIEQYPEIGRTKLMKFVFFVDLLRYNQTHDTFLEDDYIHLPNGPVPEIGFSYTEQSNGHWEIEKLVSDPERYTYRFRTRKPADLTHFTDDDLRLFNVVIRTLKTYRSETISAYTHRFDLWKDGANGEVIAKEKLQLEEYDYEDLKSFIYYAQSVEQAANIPPPDADAPSDRVPDEFISLQLSEIAVLSH